MLLARRTGKRCCSASSFADQEKIGKHSQPICCKSPAQFEWTRPLEVSSNSVENEFNIVLMEKGGDT